MFGSGGSIGITKHGEGQTGGDTMPVVPHDQFDELAGGSPPAIDDAGDRIADGGHGPRRR